MGTDVTYNGVEMTNVLTKRFLQTIVYDESNTDPLYHEFQIEVLGYVHTINSSTVDISTNRTTGTVASNEVELRQKLLEARKDFEMTIGGERLLKVSHGGTTAGAQQDANNGPKPISVEVTKFLGSTAAGGLMQVVFSIKLCVVDCYEDNNHNGVLNNRWSAHDVIDSNFFTTRTITGRLRVKHLGVNPQLFRHLVIPPLQRGFKRESVECTTSVDGLTMEYAIVDVEKFAAAPSPATEWSGSYTLSTNDNINNFAEVQVAMSGPRDADKVEMLKACILIVESKLQLSSPGQYIENAQIVDHLHENTIEMRVCARVNPGDRPLQRYALETLGIGKTITDAQIPGYDKDIWRVPKLYGTTSLTGAFVCYLQTPCDDQHVLSTGLGVGPGDNVAPMADTNVYTYEGELPTDSQVEANYSATHRSFPYVYYKVDTSYKTSGGVLQLPIASATGAETAKFVRFSGAVTGKVVRVAAERLGQWPEIPPAVDFTIGDLIAKVLYQEQRPRTPQISADRKNYLYSVDLLFEYGFNRPPAPGESLSTGSLPWDASALPGNALPPSSLTPGIIDG